MSLFLHEERRYLRGEVDKPVGESFLERDTISAVTVKFNVLLLIFATLGVLSSVLVLIGLKMNNRALLLPWILVMIADLLVECAHFMYLIVIETVGLTGNNRTGFVAITIIIIIPLKFEPLTAMLFTIDFFIMCLNIYCLLCVISQYQEYKAGRGQADDDSYTCPTNIQYSPPAPSCLPQTKTAALSPVICPHTNCTLIPEETQINGAFVGSMLIVALGRHPLAMLTLRSFGLTGVAASPPTPTVRLPATHPTGPVVRCTQRGASLLLVKKHVKFSGGGDKPKVGCCTGIIHPSESIKEGATTATMVACKPPNGLVILGAIETLPGRYICCCGSGRLLAGPVHPVVRGAEEVAINAACQRAGATESTGECAE
uniref:Putative zinc metalloprotease n=1 Tax=Anopheles darlingi TaxID=43151 RepID=A0A2M4CGB3_ANODA